MASETKRKKTFTKKETLEKLKECENNVKKAVEVILSELSPFDVTDENITCYEERLDRLEKVSSSLTRRIYRLKEDVKAKRFRRNQDLLEEDMISCSQFSVLQSEDSEDISVSFSQQSLQDEPPECPSIYSTHTVLYNQNVGNFSCNFIYFSTSYSSLGTKMSFYENIAIPV